MAQIFEFTGGRQMTPAESAGWRMCFSSGSEKEPLVRCSNGRLFPPKGGQSVARPETERGGHTINTEPSSPFSIGGLPGTLAPSPRQA